MTKDGTGCAEGWKNELVKNREVLGLMEDEYNRITSSTEEELDKWYLSGENVEIINDRIEYLRKMNSLKLMKDPETKYFGDVLGSSIGYANILIGNSFLGLWCSGWFYGYFCFDATGDDEYLKRLHCVYWRCFSRIRRVCDDVTIFKKMY